jgi:hypothetical protein
MICQRVREVFPELLDSRTAATAHLEARAHLANCPECQREFAALTRTVTALDTMSTPQPSASLRKNFYAMLEEEKHSAASVRTVAEREHRARRAVLWRWVLSPLVVCVLLLLGFLVGKRSVVPSSSEAPPAGDATTREILALREQMTQQREQLAQANSQINKMTQLVGYSILQQQQSPTNERLRDVLAAAREEKPSAKVIDDLISALTLDPNANVRLRAIEALFRHSDRDVVRAGVLAALPREQNPLVQLELIDFVAAAQDPEAAPVLEMLSNDESINRAVRDAAKLALAQF